MPARSPASISRRCSRTATRSASSRACPACRRSTTASTACSRGSKASRSRSSASGATNCTEELGINVAEDILTANPDLKAIYAACGPPAAGAAQAIKNAGIDTDDIVLVGFDFCCGEPEAIAAGIEDATVAQFPAKMAELGVDALVKAIRGEEVESLIDSGAALVTKDNMGEFQ